jgi:hypothetical protein
LITDYYPGGELFLLLDQQPTKVLKEDAVRYIYIYIMLMHKEFCMYNGALRLSIILLKKMIVL